MEVRPHRTIERKKTKLVKVGNVSVGNNSIITVQSMTNTITSDILGTVKQINVIYHEHQCGNMWNVIQKILFIITSFIISLKIDNF